MTSYEQRGVSPDKLKVKRALEGTSRSLFPGAFCQAVPDYLGGSPEHCVLMHADGAGTKSSLAYVWWRETGDASVFRNIAEDCLVMNLDDMLCVGSTGPFVYANIVNRNSGLVPEALVAEVVHGYQDLARRLGDFGLIIEPCGGETADVGDLVRTITVDAVMTSRMRRSDFISFDSVRPGLAIVGLASAGRAPWEQAVTSGLGANGFTSARHEILSQIYGERYPESFDPSIGDVAYVGPYGLLDPLPGSEQSLGEALLSPTRTYSPILVRMLSEIRPAIHGVIHNSGGGLTKCLSFGSQVRYVKTSLFDPPPIFSFLHKQLRVPVDELVRVFNLGQRMEVICDADAAADVCRISSSMGVDAKIIGYTEACDAGTELVVEAFGETVHASRGA